MQHLLPAHGSPHHSGSQQLLPQPFSPLFAEFPGTLLFVQQVSWHFFLIFFFLSHFFCFLLHFVSRHFPFLSLQAPEEEPELEDTGLGGGGELAYFCGAFPSHFTYSPSPLANVPPGQLPCQSTFLQSTAEVASVVCLTQICTNGTRKPGGHRAVQSGGGGRGGGGGGGGCGGGIGGVEGGVGGALGAPSGGNGGGPLGGALGGGALGGLNGTVSGGTGGGSGGGSGGGGDGGGGCGAASGGYGGGSGGTEGGQ